MEVLRRVAISESREGWRRTRPIIIVFAWQLSRIDFPLLTGWDSRLWRNGMVCESVLAKRSRRARLHGPREPLHLHFTLASHLRSSGRPIVHDVVCSRRRAWHEAPSTERHGSHEHAIGLSTFAAAGNPDLAESSRHIPHQTSRLLRSTWSQRMVTPSFRSLKVVLASLTVILTSRLWTQSSIRSGKSSASR